MNALETVARGAADSQQALVTLRAQTASPIDALKALVLGRGMTLGEAKDALLQSDAWRSEARQMIENDEVTWAVLRRLGLDRIDHARLKRWVDASQALAAFHQLMVLPAQQLGHLDCRLAAESPTFVEGKNAESVLGYQEHLTLAYLWVLGGYELVRVVDQRYRDDPALAPEALSKRANQVKRAFERVRIPLAKFEPSRSHRQTDSGFAWPAYHPGRDVAWQVAPGTFVSRAELADALLQLLEAMRVNAA